MAKQMSKKVMIFKMNSIAKGKSTGAIRAGHVTKSKSHVRKANKGMKSC